MSETYTVIVDGECMTVFCSMHLMRLYFTAMSGSDLFGAIEVWHEGKKIMDSAAPSGYPSMGSG
jgi:hypothetical protein